MAVRMRAGTALPLTDLTWRTDDKGIEIKSAARNEERRISSVAVAIIREEISVLIRKLIFRPLAYTRPVL
jgi:hypothetical protein